MRKTIISEFFTISILTIMITNLFFNNQYLESLLKLVCYLSVVLAVCSLIIMFNNGAMIEIKKEAQAKNIILRAYDLLTDVMLVALLSLHGWFLTATALLVFFVIKYTKDKN